MFFPGVHVREGYESGRRAGRKNFRNLTSRPVPEVRHG
jgi:hypothetical protein